MRRFSSFWLYPALSAGLFIAAVQLGERGKPLALALLFLTGLAVWTLLEYLIHRFFFHHAFRNPSLEEGRRKMHLSHHLEPRNLDHLFVRPRFSLPISALFLALSWTATGSLLLASALMSGIWAGFLYYESVHYRVHFSSRQGWALASQRRQHFRHHFVDPEAGFGVTSPLWDILLGTRRGASRHAEARSRRSQESGVRNHEEGKGSRGQGLQRTQPARVCPPSSGSRLPDS